MAHTPSCLSVQAQELKFQLVSTHPEELYGLYDPMSAFCNAIHILEIFNNIKTVLCNFR